MAPFAGFDYYRGSLGEQKTTSYALFSWLTYDVSNGRSLVGGLRYSREKKDLSCKAGVYEGTHDQIST